ncbi:MAG: hypothetical protein ACOYXT_04645 [Bacteroidota bacterium]
MKKLLCFILFGLMCTGPINVMAQFLAKGTLIGAGAIGFETYKEKTEFGGVTLSEDTHTSFALTPWAGYFIAEDLGIGAALNVELDKVKDNNSDFEQSQTLITFGPVIRYYFAEGPFAQAYAGLGTNKFKTTSGGTTSESSYGIFQWRIGAGYSIRISDTVLLDPMLSYGSSTYTNSDNSDSKIKSAGHIMLQAGFVIILKD